MIGLISDWLAVERRYLQMAMVVTEMTAVTMSSKIIDIATTITLVLLVVLQRCFKVEITRIPRTSCGPAHLFSHKCTEMVRYITSNMLHIKIKLSLVHQHTIDYSIF